MAELEIGNSVGFIDKRMGRGSTSTSVVTELTNFSSIKAMKDRLKALDSTYFTDARLNSMTRNDLVYALRLKSTDVSGI